MTKTDI